MHDLNAKHSIQFMEEPKVEEWRVVDVSKQCSGVQTIGPISESNLDLNIFLLLSPQSV